MMARDAAAAALLLQQGSQFQAAQEFAWLVRFLCPSGKRMTRQQEQELLLRPSKEFKKLRKLTGSTPVLEGLLHTLNYESDAAYLLLDCIPFLTSAPGFVKQIGSCGLADALLNCSRWLFPLVSSLHPTNPQRAPPLTPSDLNLLEAAHAIPGIITAILDLSEEFYARALEVRLVSAIMAFFPWGVPPRGRHNAERNTWGVRTAFLVAEAFKAFIDDAEKVARLLGCHVELTEWLVRFVDFLTKSAEALVPRVKYEEQHLEIQDSAKAVMGMFNCANGHALLDPPKLQELERALEALLPHLEKGARFHVDLFLTNVHGLRRVGLPVETITNGAEITDLTHELQSLAVRASKDRRATDARLDNFFRNYRLLSVASSRDLVSPELLKVLTAGFVDKVKAPGRLSEDSKGVLSALKNALRVAQGGGIDPEVFDDVALPLLRHVEPALDKLTGIAFQSLLAGLIDWRPDFDAALLKSIAEDGGPNEAPVPSPRPLAHADERRALANEIAAKQRGRLFAPAWVLVRHRVDFGVSDEDRSEDVAAVLLWCCADSGLVERKLLPKIGLLVRILALAYARLAEICGRGATSEAARRPWPDKCRTLAALLRIAFESTAGKPAARKALVEEISINGGVNLCRAVTRGGRQPGDLNREWAEAGDLLWVPGFRALCAELWETIAARFGLKACSKPTCSRDLYETKKKEFHKCSVCAQVQYCGKECQKDHWKERHKRDCRSTTDASGRQRT
ncbi:hypothetical protein KFL_000390310 [Klebsormidium nitens]|uniref:MYND-type domain-containing protein n=1 Tax=Klebsormidium nitens TaxID=105231 RepID=A0A1Y1HS76_KLENI|nr:hypothetical protein KFL_000390310 [Klebsormidium nitens]|eukprot:GAQ79841.1 hypothetical protein KFL_000390310 [Klebsormidium nitens]